jgi:hypothetical protein
MQVCLPTGRGVYHRLLDLAKQNCPKNMPPEARIVFSATGTM